MAVLYNLIHTPLTMERHNSTLIYALIILTFMAKTLCSTVVYSSEQQPLCQANRFAMQAWHRKTPNTCHRRALSVANITICGVIGTDHKCGVPQKYTLRKIMVYGRGIEALAKYLPNESMVYVFHQRNVNLNTTAIVPLFTYLQNQQCL